MSGIGFEECSRKVHVVWVWFLFFLVAVTECQQQQQKMGMQTLTTTDIRNSYFMVEKRSYCNTLGVRELIYNCFANAKENPCLLQQNMIDYYNQHKDEQKDFTAYLTTMCTDANYDKDFKEFTTCMNANKQAWADCQSTEQQVAMNFTMKLMKNESVDMVCFPEKITIHDCYKMAGDKLCPTSSKTIFNTLALGTSEKMCAANSAGAKFTFTNIIFSSISVFITVFLLSAVHI